MGIFRRRAQVSTAALQIYIEGPAQVIKWVCIYGIKVSFWGSMTLKIVISVKNHP